MLPAVISIIVLISAMACFNPVALDEVEDGNREATDSVGPAPLIVDYGNQRVVRIDNMLGGGWSATSTPNSPTDAVLDSSGNTWIGMEFGSTWKVAAFAEVSGDPLPGPVVSSDQVGNVTALAVDSQSSVVYVGAPEPDGAWDAPHALWSIGYDLVAETMEAPVEIGDAYLGSETLYRVSGLDYHDSALFAVVIFDGGVEDDIAFLLKINVDTGARLAEFEIGTVPADFNFVAHRYVGDVIVRDGSVYLADSIGAQIIEFDTDLVEIARFGAPYDKESGGPPANTEFFGPSRFAALPPEEPWFVVVDETKDGFPRESRIVRFSDMSGSDWLTHGEHGTADGEFWFFDFC